MTLEVGITESTEDDGVVKVVNGHQVVNSVTTPKDVTVAVDNVAVYSTVVSMSWAVNVEVRIVKLSSREG